MTRNVLKIAKTNPADATLEVTTEFVIAGEQSTLPVIYQVQDEEGAAQYIVAISQDFGAWTLPQPLLTTLVVNPDRTRIQLLDVRDPYNVSQAWEVELDGWLRASRKIGSTLYLVNSYRPRLAGLAWPTDTEEKRQANERRVRNAGAQDLMPKVRINGGLAQQLATPGDCVIAADLASEEAYTDLLVITTVDLNERKVSDIDCVSTNVNGLYVSQDSLYVGGQASPQPHGVPITVLHKFALEANGVSYRATGGVPGHLPWTNASYFMDEYEGRLRVVTSREGFAGTQLHHLSILEEAANHHLEILSMLPSPEHPEPIGKPGDQVHAVRFMGDRAYVVTARTIDPLYVIDVSDPFEPFIAGELEVPGTSTHLEPLSVDDADLLLSIGRRLGPAGTPLGMKVELFDVSDISLPRSLGAHVVGDGLSSSEAIGDPHALTVMTVPGEQVSHRVGFPADVYAEGSGQWAYSGFHFFEVSGVGGSPALHVQGVIKTDESSGPGAYPKYVAPRRVVMHGDAVYGVNGGTYTSSPWDHITSN
jgi:hypothetical protein